MSDLARLAGVSKSTVSRALAGSERVTKETRDRIQQLAREHNYRMNVRASNFRKKELRTVGVLLPSNGDIDWLATDPFMLEMLGALSDALEERGQHELLLAKHSNNDPSWIDEFARTRTVDGIIVIGQSLYHEQLNETAEWHQGMVVWGTEIPGQNYYTVGSDNYQGGKMAAEHLLEQGRERIAFLGDKRFPETRERYRGYIDALKSAGLNNPLELRTDSDTGIHINEATLHEYLEQPPSFDALIASSDTLGINAIRIINNHGYSVPEDIAVVGYDNITLSEYCNPTLTSISQDRKAAATTLIDKVFELMDTGKTTSETIPTHLVVRESSTEVAKKGR